MTLQEFFANNKTSFISEKVLHKNKTEDLALEPSVFCGQQVKNWGSVVAFLKKISQLATGYLKMTLETFLWVDKFNLEGLTSRDLFLWRLED